MKSWPGAECGNGDFKQGVTQLEAAVSSPTQRRTFAISELGLGLSPGRHAERAQQELALSKNTLWTKQAGPKYFGVFSKAPVNPCSSRR